MPGQGAAREITIAPGPQQPNGKSHTGRRVQIVALIVVASMIALIVVSTVSSATDSDSVKVTGVNISISYMGPPALGLSYLGPSSQYRSASIAVKEDGIFTYALGLTTGKFLSYSYSINAVEVEPFGEFYLISTSPSLSYSLTPNSTATINLTIMAPDFEYDGSITIIISTSSCCVA